MTIAFIPIRSGSKGIPNKNIKDFCGKPLVYWMAKAASDCDKIHEVHVAVDSDQYEDIVNSFALPKVQVYRRSAKTAQDSSTTEDVMLEFITDTAGFCDYDTFLLIQATSPLTTSADLDRALTKFGLCEEFDSMLSGVRFKRFFWNWKGEPLNYDYSARPLRQEWNGSLLENGSFYINTVGNILRDKCRLSGSVGIYALPEWHQYEIDGTEDWEVLENIFRANCMPSPELDTSDIKMVYMDIDGTLTDGKTTVSERGEEFLTFSKRDGHGIELLHKAGIAVVWATNESNVSAMRARARKLKIKFFIHNEPDKYIALSKLCMQQRISLSNQVAGIGDDINDLEILERIRLKACPSDAHEAIKNIPNMLQLSKPGGEGAVREFIDTIILK